MASSDTFGKVESILNSPLKEQMENAFSDMSEWNTKFQGGTKSAGAKARKRSSEWGKCLRDRLKELKEVKQLLSQYRKETIQESKNN